MWHVERIQSYVITESKIIADLKLIKLFLNSRVLIYWSVLHRLNHYKYLTILKSSHGQEFHFSGLAASCLLFLCVWCLYFFPTSYIFWKNKADYILDTKEKFADAKNTCLGLCASVCLLSVLPCAHIRFNIQSLIQIYNEAMDLHTLCKTFLC